MISSPPSKTMTKYLVNIIAAALLVACEGTEESSEAPIDVISVEVRAVATPLVWSTYAADELRFVFRGVDVWTDKPFNVIAAERRIAPPTNDEEMIAVVFEREDFPTNVNYNHRGAFHWHFTVEVLRAGEVIDSYGMLSKASSSNVVVPLPRTRSCVQDADCLPHFECLKGSCLLQGVFDSPAEACDFTEQCVDKMCTTEYFVCDPSPYWF